MNHLSVCLCVIARESWCCLLAWSKPAVSPFALTSLALFDSHRTMSTGSGYEVSSPSYPAHTCTMTNLNLKFARAFQVLCCTPITRGRLAFLSNIYLLCV